MPGIIFDKRQSHSQRGQQKDESRKRPRNANIEERALANRSRTRMRMNAPKVPTRLGERKKVGQARVQPVVHARDEMAEFMRQSEWSAASAKTAGPRPALGVAPDIQKDVEILADIEEGQVVVEVILHARADRAGG